MGKDLEKLRKEWLSYHKADKELSHAEEAFLSHHGILGMKWGIRRFQNKDGTRTPAGKKRYSEANKETNEKGESSVPKEYDRKTLYSDLEQAGFKQDAYGDYEKTISNPDKNIKDAVIQVDGHDGFRTPGLTNDEIMTTVKDLETNFKTINSHIKDQMAEYAAQEEYGGPWSWENSDMSREELKTRFKNNLGGYENHTTGVLEPGFAYFRIMQDGYGEVSYDDGGAYYGHYLSTELDWKTKKISGPYSVNG